MHDVVDDQDVIVTPGANTPLTIIDPFKPATVTLKARDSKSGKLLPGSTVNIGTGDTTLLTLTTGAGGTASAKLPVNSRTGTTFWAKQTKAPAGYEIYKPSKTFTAGPGAPVTVTVTNSKRSTSTNPDPTEKPRDKPTSTASTPGDKLTGGTSGGTSGSPADSATPEADVSGEATPKAPAGSLAHTGADATPWLLGGAGLLVVGGIGAVVAARLRRTDSGENPQSGEG